MYNILILDDEIISVYYLKEILEDLQKNNLFLKKFNILIANKYDQFIEILKEKKPEIILLDIQMPNKNGLEIAQELRENYKKFGYLSSSLPLIIFTTAYENYGYKAFKVDAIDYILKPINEDLLLQSFLKIEKNYSVFFENNEDYIYVNSSGLDIKVPIKEILYFKAEMKYITIITYKKEFILNETLIHLENIYKNFIKIHRSYLINPIYIEKIYRKNSHNFMILKHHPLHLPISRRQRNEIKNKISYDIYFQGE